MWKRIFWLPILAEDWTPDQTFDRIMIIPSLMKTVHSVNEWGGHAPEENRDAVLLPVQQLEVCIKNVHEEKH